MASGDPYFCGHMYLSWDKIRLHTIGINQVPRLHGGALKVSVVDDSIRYKWSC